MASIKKGSVFTLVGLYLLTIPFFNALNVTSYDNSQILGHFGASTTVFTYSTYIPFFAMLGFLPLGLKIGKQVPLRTLILSVSFLSIICNTASLFATTIQWFTFWRTLLAILSIIGIFASMTAYHLRSINSLRGENLTDYFNAAQRARPAALRFRDFSSVSSV